MRASCGYLRIPPTSDFVGGTSVCHLILVTLSSNPIGRQTMVWVTGSPWWVLPGNSKYHYLSEAPLPYFYVPFRQMYRADLNLAFFVRHQATRRLSFRLSGKKAREIDPGVTVFDSCLYPSTWEPRCIRKKLRRAC